MVRYTISVVLAASLAVFASPFNKRTVSQIKADITTISSEVTSLDSSINNFANPGGTLAQALAIHSAAQKLVTAINTVGMGTSDTKNTPGPVSESDGRSILDSVEAFEPKILDALQKIVAKKPAFQALPIGNVTNLVHQDLTDLSGATSALENALTADAPADLVAEATQNSKNVNAAFAAAIAAYQ